MSLYKYLIPDRIDVLINRKIRFSQPAVLNDPFEISPNITAMLDNQFIDSLFKHPNFMDYAMQSLEKQLTTEIVDQNREFWLQALNDMLPTAKAIAPELFGFGTELTRQLLPQLTEQLLILCLSESWDNKLMWAHYADSHRGFIISFDEKNTFFNKKLKPKDSLRHLRKVKYSENRPSATLIQMTEEEFLLVKSKEWEYENEWRMFMHPSLADQTIQIEQHPPIYLFEFPINSVEGIIFGMNSSQELQSEIMKLRAIYPHIYFRKIVQDPSSYNLSYIAL